MVTGFGIAWPGKTELGETIGKLKSGDRIRIIGKVTGMGTSIHWLYADSIQVLPALRAATSKEAH